MQLMVKCAYLSGITSPSTWSPFCWAMSSAAANPFGTCTTHSAEVSPGFVRCCPNIETVFSCGRAIALPVCRHIRRIAKAAVEHQVWSLNQSLYAYSCVLNTSHTVLGDMPDFLSETCLYYKTCHTILSKTRLEYRTHQLSIDVTMTSFLLWSNKGRFKTRLKL